MGGSSAQDKDCTFSLNITHSLQLCDSFIIQKMKSGWAKNWEKYKMDKIQQNLWKDGSGRFYNSGKTFFLKFSARTRREINQQRDKEGLSYSRKAIVITRMALNTNGNWEVSQLRPQLQAIVHKHRNIYENTAVAEETNSYGDSTDPSEM